MRILYNILWYFLTPLMHPWLWWRLHKNKEEKGRLQERFGLYIAEKTEKPIIWLHGASVGETLSLRPIIAFLRQEYPDYTILITTGTKTAARLILQQEQGDIIHQYIPLDHPLWTKRFFDHWKPSLGILVESEFWPNFILNAPCPMWLLSGRLTPDSYQRWKKWFPKFFRSIMEHFSLVFAQTEADAARLKEFHKGHIFISNLKYLAKPLPIEKTTINTLEKMIGSRPFWIAASTHPGEEKIIIQAHQYIKEKIPNILTIIAPRHPIRGDDIRGLLPPDFFGTQRSRQENITAKTDIYIADTMGELGSLFSISSITLVAGSLLPNIGGHNLLEPAFFGNAILHGPHMHKSLDMYDLFTSAHASFVVKDEKDIANCVIVLLEDKKKLAQQQAATQEVMAKLQKDQKLFWNIFKTKLESTLL
jgi:3-deoxy-D-manno-octulosonic-acid transferase